LAAWIRGLNVIFIKNINNYRITSPEKSLFFCNSAIVGGRYGLLTHATCKDKHKTKFLLQKNHVNTPEGKLFDESASEDEIVIYAEQLSYPVVSASLKFVRSKVEKLLLLTYEKITIYRIPNYLHSFPA